MPRSIKRSPRTARVTRHLDPPVETTNVDGDRILARTLFVNAKRRTDGSWFVCDVTVSAALPLVNGPGWRKTYLEHEIDPELFSDEINDVLDMVTSDCERYEKESV